APGEESNRCKESYNRAAPAEWPQFTDDIALTLGLYDGFDGICGNQWLAARQEGMPGRYAALARLLTDDRLWVDSSSATCRQYFSVELAHIGSPDAHAGDCGGRTPEEDAVDVFRSLLVLGRTAGVEDGVERDDQVHSLSVFPFLAAPSADAAAASAPATTTGAIAIENLDHQIAEHGGAP